MAHNIDLMARYASDHRLALAPHGKTTLAPALFHEQLEAGAWGITVADVAQATVAFGAGAERVLIANEVVGRAETEAAARLLASGGRELLCLVDSVRGVELLDRHLDRLGLGVQLAVLVELGVSGGRAGVRDAMTGIAVARAVSAARWLTLAGAEGYEGVIASERTQAALESVDRYLMALREFSLDLLQQGLVERDEAIVSAGGSKYFDRVAAVLGPLAAGNAAGRPALVVARPGCYVTHDNGIYDAVSPLAQAGGGYERLLPALELWASVLSMPEPGLAIVGFGKRDAPSDVGLPVPLRRAAAASSVAQPFDGASVSALDDQHAYLHYPDDAELDIGDRLCFGVSHPCTAFDKWRTVLIVDAHGCVQREIATAFH